MANIQLLIVVRANIGELTNMGYTSAVRKCIQIEIRKKFNLIHEKEWTGHAISIICKRYGVSRKTYYKWKNRYKQKGIEGLLDLSRRPNNIRYKKITSEVEETILDLRLTKRFGSNRIRFRLKRIIGLSLSTRTIYKILKKHGLNILKCKTKIRSYKRFAMKHPNDMVQMDILGPFYLSNSSEMNYIISCLDDCSRKVASRWSERKRSIDVLNVLEDWIMTNGKQFTSNIFRHFLVHNHVKDKLIPNSYPQLQGKIEAYNKIVKNEFIALEDIPNIDDGKLRYDMFVKAYNEAREHGGINGLTPSEMFLQWLITSIIQYWFLTKKTCELSRIVCVMLFQNGELLHIGKLSLVNAFLGKDRGPITGSNTHAYYKCLQPFLLVRFQVSGAFFADYELPLICSIWAFPCCITFRTLHHYRSALTLILSFILCRRI
jgi:transposase